MSREGGFREHRRNHLQDWPQQKPSKVSTWVQGGKGEAGRRGGTPSSSPLGHVLPHAQDGGGGRRSPAEELGTHESFLSSASNQPRTDSNSRDKGALESVASPGSTGKRVHFRAIPEQPPEPTTDVVKWDHIKQGCSQPKPEGGRRRWAEQTDEREDWVSPFLRPLGAPPPARQPGSSPRPGMAPWASHVGIVD